VISMPIPIGFLSTALIHRLFSSKTSLLLLLLHRLPGRFEAHA
jgi:hypothetical protein